MEQAQPVGTITPLLQQIQEEHHEGVEFMKPRWTALGELYKMLCNKRGGPAGVGKRKISTKLMYTYYHTVLASMYSDTLKTEFEPRTEEDIDHCENIKLLADYDFDLMDKPQVDYEWLATTLVEGSSLLLMYQWNKELSTPDPIVIDGLSLIRDPFALSVKGNANGEKKLRYFGRYIFLTEAELKKRFEDGLYTGDWENIPCYNQSTEDDRQRQDRLVVLGYNKTEPVTKKGGNRLYKLLEWFTYHDGKPVFVTTDSNATAIYRMEKVYTKFLPVIKRVINPIPGQWDGYSICELVEDFHKEMNIAIGSALDVQKSGAYPRYLYDRSRIENQADLIKAHFNQYIPVEGSPEGIIAEMPRKQVSQDTSFVINQLDSLAQRATATGEIQQGVQAKAYRSATEQALVQQNTDTRYGLTAKVLTWSEREFWKMWYLMVKKYFPSAKKKLIRLKGDEVITWRPLTRDQITTVEDPDIKVTSFGELAQERQRKLQALTMVSQELLMNPLADQQYIIKRKLELQGFTQDEINRVFPPTIDKMIAEMENEQLSKNTVQKIHAQDDDYQHIREHMKALRTPARDAHIKAHKVAWLKKKARPDLQEMSKGGSAPSAQEQTVQPNTPNLPRMDTPANQPHGNTMIS